MKQVKLGKSDLVVSELCLGSMIWGSGDTEEVGHAQIDRALDGGINFIDTAEVYPTYPVKAETVGDTECIIGNWIAKSGRRDDIVLATKVAGPNPNVRGGQGYDGSCILDTIDASLSRLQTDVIDLYQLHAPIRGSYAFRRNWNYDPSKLNREEIVDHMTGVLEALDKAIKAGKVRAIGVSNETVWGTAMWLRIADENNLPRMSTIQNEYSLLYRMADTDLAELCCVEDVSLLPYSPLAMGLVSGKHSPQGILPGTRREVSADLNGRVTPNVWPAVDAYCDIAKRHGLDVNAMALAWTLTRPFVGSTIFGARTDAQLDAALSAADLMLSDEIVAEIDAAWKSHPMPF